MPPSPFQNIMLEEKSKSNDFQVTGKRRLFLNEVGSNMETRQYGAVLLTRSLSSDILTSLFLLIAISIIAFFFYFSTARKVQSQGFLVPNSGVIRISSAQQGVISGKYVKEGEYVKKGDLMFSLRNERENLQTISTESSIADLLQSRRTRLDLEIETAKIQFRHKQEALAVQKKRILDQISNQQAQIKLQERRALLAEQSYKRFKTLLAKNFISTAQLQEKEIDLLEQQHRILDLQRLSSSSQRDLADVIIEAENLLLDNKREVSTLERERAAAQLDIAENQARKDIAIRAPHDGMVTAIIGEIGQPVGANVRLASLIPLGSSMVAEIYATSRSVGFIKPGMTVRLRYHAYPYQKFGQHNATVEEIANTAVRLEELSIPTTGPTSNSSGEPLYRIRLKLDKQFMLAYGKEIPLRSGMLLDATIILEHRKLYEWVLEPAFSIYGKI